MAYEIPAASALKARYPEFAGVPDDTVTLAIQEASTQVSERWREEDYAPAIMLLAAHNLIMEGAVDRAAGKTSTMTTTGPIKSKSVGEVSVTYAGAGSGAGGTSGNAAGYGATEFGRRFLALMRKNFAGPMAV